MKNYKKLYLLLFVVLFLVMGTKVNAKEINNFYNKSFVSTSENTITQANILKTSRFLATSYKNTLTQTSKNALEKNLIKSNLIKEKIAKPKEIEESKTTETKKPEEQVNDKDNKTADRCEFTSQEEQNLKEKPTINITEISKIMYSTTSLNIRKGPSTDFEICGHLSLNEEVNVTGICNNDWVQISINNESLFVNGKYLSDEKVQIQEPKQTSSTAPIISEQVNGIAETIGNVSKNNLNIVNEKLSLLPQNAINRFQNEGWHIYLTDENIAITMFGGEYSKVMGGTDYNNHFIKIEDRSDAVNESVLHEFGHFVFFINGGFGSQEIIDAYNTDVSNAEALGITYGLDKTEEFYAEVFDFYIRNPEKTSQYCPNLVNIIQNHISNL